MYTKVTNNSFLYQQQTKQAYVAYLDTFSWDFFLTGSTRYELTLKSARRLIERWYERVRLEGCTTLFWVAEPFELKDGHHLHGLLELPNCGKQYYKLMIDWWQWATGNGEGTKEKWNALNLQTYDTKRNAGSYCSKYVMKDRSDYDILC
ncbi:hypothetical protein ES705_46400 [subsurface metagenome]